jgi:hypothetical protein
MHNGDNMGRKQERQMKGQPVAAVMQAEQFLRLAGAASCCAGP